MEPGSGLRGETPDERANTELRLRVSGIRLTGYHGVFPEERESGNRFDVDVEVDCTSLAAAETDELEDTIDYRQITDLVHEINRRQAFNLIESFAGAIANGLLAKHRTISAVAVRVSKLGPPGLADVDRVTAEVARWRR